MDKCMFFLPKNPSLYKTIILTTFITGTASMFLTACKQQNSASTGLSTQSTFEQKCEIFSKQLEVSVNERNPQFINAHFNLDTLVNKVVATIDAPSNYKLGFAQGIKANLDVGQQIVSSLGVDGHYKFLQLRNMPQKPTALFRLNTEEGVNYHEIYLKPNKDNIIIDDLYIYEGGMSFSNTLKRVFFASLSTAIDSISFEKTSPFDKGFIENLDKIDEIAALVEKNKHLDALKVVKNLPEIVRIDKMIMVLQLKIAKECGQEAYQIAIDDFRSHYPSDPVLEFMLLENALEKNKPSEILAAIDQLDNRIGSDTYLNVLRADVAVKQKNYLLAEELLNKAKAAEPNNESIYWHLVSLFLKQKQYEKTTSIFTEMKNLFNFDPAERLPQYEFRDFLQSKIYKEYSSSNNQ